MAATIETGQRIRNILRRDLKLGATAELPDSMPLIGGNMDLDSLDVLLLITNLEKEFGFKIASQEVGQQAFKDVGSLIRFVSSKVAGVPTAATGPASAAPSGVDLLGQLPHREPFRFISRLGEVRPGVSGEASWALDGKEAFFTGHFPGNPLVPGVLIAEALAQLSGLVGASADASGPRLGKLAQVDVRFLAPVAPPAEIALQAKALGAMGLLRQFEVTALVAGAPIAQGRVTISYQTAPEAR